MDGDPRQAGAVRPGVEPDFSLLLGASAGEALADVADAVFPALCPLCRGPEPGDGLGCAEHRLPLEPPGPRCGRCASALPPSIADGERCADCRIDPPSFARTIALADYRAQPPAREWILALKHGRRPDLALSLGRALGARLASAGGRAGDEPPILVPVPLHGLRRLERGYDQALLLARAAAEVEGLRVVRALRRARFTAVQGSLGAPSRTANVAGAFRERWIWPRPARMLAGREVWLVDDVVTSGATASECARALKRLGAARVGVLAVARAQGTASVRHPTPSSTRALRPDECPEEVASPDVDSDHDRVRNAASSLSSKRAMSSW